MSNVEEMKIEVSLIGDGFQSLIEKSGGKGPQTPGPLNIGKTRSKALLEDSNLSKIEIANMDEINRLARK